MRVLGISAFYHDSAAALVRDGEIVAAAQEERFTRRRHTAAFPRGAIAYCLDEDGVDVGGLDAIVFYDKPLLKFERLLDTYIATAPRGFASFRAAMPVWVSEKLFLKRRIARELGLSGSGSAPILFASHHQSHAASAFYPSPFDEAAILTMDGVGEWTTTSMGTGRGDRIALERVIRWPNSLGLLYSAFTYHAGFTVNSGEYKLMGLAPYGEPSFREAILGEVIDLKPDGSFRLNQRYFDYVTGLRMTSPQFDRLFGGPARDPSADISQREMDLAASIQAVVEEAILRTTRTLARTTGLSRLCMAGGVALNCVANGKIVSDDAFAEVWVQPSPGDAGGAIGAALAAYHARSAGRARRPPRDRMAGSLLGPRFVQAGV